MAKYRRMYPYDLGIEPPTEPPAPPVEHCLRCGEVATFASDAGNVFCAECVDALALDKYNGMSLDERAEWAGFERID